MRLASVGFELSVSIHQMVEEAFVARPIVRFGQALANQFFVEPASVGKLDISQQAIERIAAVAGFQFQIDLLMDGQLLGECRRLRSVRLIVRFAELAMGYFRCIDAPEPDSRGSLAFFCIRLSDVQRVAVHDMGDPKPFLVIGALVVIRPVEQSALVVDATERGSDRQHDQPDSPFPAWLGRDRARP